MLAQIRYYYKIPHPEELDEDYIIMLYQDLEWLRIQEAKRQPSISAL
jgi:hypothetical protein